MTHRLLLLVMTLTLAVGLAAPTREAKGDAKRPSKHASITSGLDCSACHTPTSWRLMEGGAGGGGFDHGRTGFPLTGRHEQAACTGCHRGGARALSRACATCHEDAHRGRLGQACDRCHSARGWTQVAAFERHRVTRLPLSGMHALADCTECHRQTTDRVMRNVPADCFACHANEYRRPDTHPLHTGVPGDPSKPPFPRNCAQCHRPTGWSPALVGAGGVAALRSALVAPPTHEARFPIRAGKHRDAPCESCHLDPRAPRLVRCDGCHEHSASRLASQHRVRISLASAACLSCHPGGAAR